MQNLLQVLNREIVITNDNQTYQDTLENFVLDGGVDFADNFIYNKTLKLLVVNDEIKKFEPIEDYENVIDNVAVYISIKEERLAEERVEPVLTDQDIQNNLTNAVQAFMDKTVRTRNYDSIATACTYAASTDHIFAAEGIACVKWRDEVWRYCYEYLEEVKAGTKEVPTAEELIAMLPTLEW